MKVVCIRLISPVTRQETSESEWLTLDSEYVVLAIEGNPGRELSIRVQDDKGGGPGLWPAEMFMTTSTALPSSWIISIGDNGQFDLAPAKWLRPGFWEDFFDREPEALADFEEEKANILAEADEESWL